MEEQRIREIVREELAELCNTTETVREPRLQKVLDSEIKKARETEMLIGIDPNTYLGKEILRTARKTTELDIHIAELTSSVNRLRSDLKNKV